MSADRKFRMPASVIILDLIGTLLLLVGGFDLMNAPLMGPVSQLAAGYGWPLVIAGGLSMLLGAGLFVSSWLAIQRSGQPSAAAPAIRTVDRRAR
jgi:hypothetical protein